MCGCRMCMPTHAHTYTLQPCFALMAPLPPNPPWVRSLVYPSKSSLKANPTLILLPSCKKPSQNPLVEEIFSFTFYNSLRSSSHPLTDLLQPVCMLVMCRHGWERLEERDYVCSLHTRRSHRDKVCWMCQLCLGPCARLRRAWRRKRRHC